MTIGDKFIFLYIPKTGSSFTLSVFNKINKKINGFFGVSFYRKPELLTKSVKSPNNRDRFYNYKYDQHTSVNQISKDLLNGRQLVSIMRSPFRAYVSRFEYKSYSKKNIMQSQDYIKVINTKFPNFPNLSFEEYIEFNLLRTDDKLKNHLKVKPKVIIGGLSLQFIQMFAYDPNEVLKILDFNFFKNGFYKSFFPDVKFLNNENLTNELYYFLIEMGYPKSLLNFIKDKKRKNVSVNEPYQNYLDESIKSRIFKLEWFLFEFFSDKKDRWLKA